MHLIIIASDIIILWIQMFFLRDQANPADSNISVQFCLLQFVHCLCSQFYKVVICVREIGVLRLSLRPLCSWMTQTIIP